MDVKFRADGIEVLGSVAGDFAKILTPEALQFIGRLAVDSSSRGHHVRRPQNNPETVP